MKLIFRRALEDIKLVLEALEAQEDGTRKSSMENLYPEKGGIKNACDDVIERLDQLKNI